MTTPGHAVLLGDSIFDNARYVPGDPDVVQQLRARLPESWQATLLAIDGDITRGVAHQLKRVPPDATHLFISVGGNDALGESYFVRQPASSVADVMTRLHELQTTFGKDYRAMLKAVLALGKPTTVCTIYDAIPGPPSPPSAPSTKSSSARRSAFRFP